MSGHFSDAASCRNIAGWEDFFFCLSCLEDLRKKFFDPSPCTGCCLRIVRGRDGGEIFDVFRRPIKAMLGGGIYMSPCLAKYFGFSSFRPGQRELFEAVLAGNDALGGLPTGGGKSLTYQLPSVLLSGLTIVVSPLIALIKDQVDAFNRRGGKQAVAIHSNM